MQRQKNSAKKDAIIAEANKICEICNIQYAISKFPSFIRENGNGYILNQCKDCNKKIKHIHYMDNKLSYKEKGKKWLEDNKESRDLYIEQYKYDNKEKIKTYNKNYQIKNKEKLNAYHCSYNKKRKAEDPHFRMRRNVSKLVNSYLSRLGFRKNQKSILDYLNYSIDDLKMHIEGLFEPWMNWGNQGKYLKKEWDDNDQKTWKWQLDHIISQKNFNYTSLEDENFKKCWKLENLRPLSAKENLFKGSK